SRLASPMPTSTPLRPPAALPPPVSGPPDGVGDAGRPGVVGGLPVVDVVVVGGGVVGTTPVLVTGGGEVVGGAPVGGGAEVVGGAVVVGTAALLVATGTVGVGVGAGGFDPPFVQNASSRIRAVSNNAPAISHHTVRRRPRGRGDDSLLCDTMLSSRPAARAGPRAPGSTRAEPVAAPVRPPRLHHRVPGHAGSGRVHHRRAMPAGDAVLGTRPGGGQADCFAGSVLLPCLEPCSGGSRVDSASSRAVSSTWKPCSASASRVASATWCCSAALR